MSYHKSGDEIKQKVKNSLIMEWKKFTAQVEANLIAAHNKVDYLRRDGLPVSLKYNKLLFDTKLYLELKYKKRNKLSFSYVVKSAMPYENDMLEVVDYTNPMSITTGNASLKAIITNTLSLRWTTKSINFDITFDKENNGVEHMMLYDPQTGVSVTRPENVGGTYSLSSNLRYLAQLGDFTFSAETDYSLDHSLLGSWTSMSSSQSNGYVDHHRARFDGQMKYGNSFCTQELGFRYAYNLIHRKGGFADNIRMTYTTGLASEFNLPMGFVLGSSVNWQSRHGDRVVSNEKSDLVIWNLSLARRFLKSKMLTVKVSANDMLHQRTNYQINYTDNGWSEQRNEGDAHYFMLSLVFHFNKM